MTETEGVVKYRLDYHAGALPSDVDLDGMARWFAICREHELIGRDPLRYEGYAYGNISARATRGFVISATQSGGEPALGADMLSWVEDFDVATNRLTAGGPARPSSEAMSHGQVYRALSWVDAVIHVHSPRLWLAATALDLPVTPGTIAYGTPEMAAAVDELLRDTTEQRAAAFAMGGHEDGVIAYANDFDAAGGLLLDLLRRVAG